MQQYFLGLILAALVITSCSDSSTIGADILDDEKINVTYKDDFELSSKTLAGESFVIDINANKGLYDYYLVGQVDDPIFGKYGGDMYFSFFPTSSEVSILDGASLDSVVLSMVYDSLGMIGDTSVAIDFELKVLEESILEYDTVRIEKEFMLSSETVGSATTTARPRTKVKIFDPLVDSVVTSSPQLRIKLSEAFSNKLFMDTTVIKNDTLMNKNYFGFNLSVANMPNRLVSFNPRNENSRILMYYTDKEGKKRRFSFGLRSKIFQHIDQDVAGSKVENAINTPTTGDDLVYIQGLKGTDIEVQLPDLSEYKKELINLAYLEMTYAEDAVTELHHNSFSPINQLFISTKNDKGDLVYISDITKHGATDLAKGLSYHEGTIREETVDGEKIRKVRFVITDYIKDIIDGDAPNTCIVRPRQRAQSGKSSIFYGAKHSKYPIKLKITSTSD